jgi:hypothetical protein
MTVSTNSVTRSVGQSFEPAPHINAALINRLCGLLPAGLMLPASAMPLASPFDVWSLKK